MRRRAMVTLTTGSTEHGPVHCRCWEVPADDAAMDVFASTLTRAYGTPTEWLSDETDGRKSYFFYQDEP